jgi:hypothetical protein
MTRAHSALTLIGVALVVGFFLPWFSFGWLHGISGWDMVWHGQGEWLSRLALASTPVLGGLLIAAGVNRSRAAASLGFLVGAGILGYVTVKIAWGLIVGTGLGLWLVLGGAIAAVAIGARAQAPKSLPEKN